MSSTFNIQPYSVSQNSTKIELFLQYQFNAIDGTVFVYFKDNNDNTIDTKTVFIPEEIYSSWQQDETIINYVLTQLNLTASI